MKWVIDFPEPTENMFNAPLDTKTAWDFYYTTSVTQQVTHGSKNS